MFDVAGAKKTALSNPCGWNIKLGKVYTYMKKHADA